MINDFLEVMNKLRKYDQLSQSEIDRRDLKKELVQI